MELNNNNNKNDMINNALHRFRKLRYIYIKYQQHIIVN